MLKVKLNEKEKLQLNFEKSNSKYNRLWEQLTNIVLFILASAIAYLITYLQINTNTYPTLEANIRASNLLNIATKILLAAAIIIAVGVGFLLAHLISAGLNVHKIMREQGL